MTWSFFGSCVDGNTFEISGINVWTHSWNPVASERVAVIDPLHGQNFQVRVYEITCDRGYIKFAAGEFSNCVWGFYVEK